MTSVRASAQHQVQESLRDNPNFEQNIEETNQFVKKTSFLKLLNKYKYNSSQERGPESFWIVTNLRNQL